MKKLYVWGNHHCESQNGFQRSFTQLITDHTILPKPLFHEIESFDGLSIRNLLDNLDSEPALIIIITGDVDIREGGNEIDVFDQFDRLYYHLDVFDELKVVTCGLITEPSADEEVEHQLAVTNFRLKNLPPTPKNSFVDVERLFDESDFMFGDILNRQGSHKLANRLMEHLFEFFPEYAKP